MGADLLHAAGDDRRMNPHAVRAEDAAAPGYELLEDVFLLGGELVGCRVEEAAHGAYGPLFGLRVAEA
jgi:hypothetical protein